MTLLEIERAMANAVMRPLTAGYGMRKKSPDGASVPAEAARFIKPNKRLSSFERLEIYNRQYWFRILSAFSEDFPGLEATVGNQRFGALARAYLEAHPSRSFTLRNLGSNLEAWLRANPKWAGRRQEVALDVTRLEWAYVEAFDNGEEPALSLEDIGRLGPDSCLSLQPHLRLLDLAFAVDDFIIEVHRRLRSSGISSNAVTKARSFSRSRHPKNFKPCAIFLAVHRFDDSVYYMRLEPEAYRLLQGLREGRTLGAALEDAFDNNGVSLSDHAADIQQWFTRWAELGWFCRPGNTRARGSRERKKKE